MTRKLHDEVLFHVELQIATEVMRRAVEPDMPKSPQGFMSPHFLEACDAARGAQAHLTQKFIGPAMRCIMGAQGLHEMLNQCGHTAVIRISLERPMKEPDSDECVVMRPYPFTIDNRESPLDPEPKVRE